MGRTCMKAEARAALWSKDNIAFDQRRRTMTNPEKSNKSCCLKLKR